MKKQIKVAHVIGKWLGGGVEAVVMNYYRNIDKNKIQFDFLCDSDSTDIPYEEIESMGGRVLLIPPYQKIFEYQKSLKKIFKENEYDIIHSHINALSVFPLYAAKKAGIKVRIAHSHSTTNKIEWKKNILKQLLRPFSKVFSTHYMCCTEHAGRWLFGNKQFNKGNVFVLNNGINLESFSFNENARKDMRKQFKIKDDTIVFGHIGRFVKQKNHDFIIDVFNEYHKKNDNSILLLVGQGPLMEEIKNKVKKYDIMDCVIFLGQRDDVNKIYQMMDLFIFPSLYEGLGMVLIEAQTAGVPCIASNFVPLDTKVTKNIEYVNLNEVNEWVEKIDSLLRIKRKNYVKEVGSYGYNISIEAKKLENKYAKYVKEVK